MLLVDRSTKRGMYNAPKLNRILTKNEPSGNDALAMNMSMLANLGLFSSPILTPVPLHAQFDALLGIPA